MNARLRVLTLLVLGLLLSAAFATGSSAAEEVNCSAAANPVKCENALPGTPEATWNVKGIGDSTIQGYATAMSVNAGETEKFKIKTTSTNYHLDIYRLGYYGDNGARLIAANVKPTASLPQTQPECLKEASTGLIDCGNWGLSAQWTVPSTSVSGVYMALLTRSDTGGKSQIIFVVRNDASHSKMLVTTSDATWQAYNAYGGNSLYTCTVSCPAGSPKEYKGAYSVSYNRPFDGSLATDAGASYLYYAEYQLIRFLERNGYDVSYTSDANVDQSAARLEQHQIFVSSGHDEYWSAGQRANVEAAREAGVNLAFFSANEIFWKTRWGNSTEGASTPYRTLTAYKETHFEGPADPLDQGAGSHTWTGSWRDPRGGPEADGGKPENSLSGQQFEINSGTTEITVPSSYAKLRLWRNTAVANLKPGQTLTLAPGTGTLGYEWDEDVDNGFRPAGEFDLSETHATNLQAFTDFGTTLDENASGTHHLILYRAPSGALVFGAGTVQWAWGLDDSNAWDIESTDPGAQPPDPNMQQATVNLFADMGVQPETLMAGLVTPSKTSDTTAPTSSITSPNNGETVADGSALTVSGTATDAGGGVVAGVEVTLDNGATWHPATISGGAASTVNWSYSGAAHGYPTETIKSRATDDSANLEAPAGGVQLKINCPCSIWGETFLPEEKDVNDGNGVELGVKFTTETFGQITGVRFYKSAQNVGTHTGSLWTAGGERLATATFTGETASGWQQVTFASPVAVNPGTTYVASYYAPNGNYSATPNYFFTPPPTGGTQLSSPPLKALSADGAPSGGFYTSANGVYSYSGGSTFPTSSYTGTNYWVDPTFAPAGAPGQVTAVSASGGPSSATVSWSAPTSGGAVTKYTITPFVGSEAKTATVIGGNPPANGTTITGLTNGITYTFKVAASNPNGSGPASEPSNAVTPSTSSAPNAPSAVSAIVATGQAQVSWSAPSSNGGSAITGYTVTPFIGASPQTHTEVGAGSTTATVKGLTNGTAYTFKVSASNLNGEGPQSVASGAVMPENTIFDFATPSTVDSGDGSSVELGVKFSSETAGNVTGIRFYKAAGNTGTHSVGLYTSTGTLLATATASGESASGWQQVNFAKPVAINPSTTYVAAYFAPNGHYSDTPAGLKAAAVNAPLTALANTTSADGIYAYSSSATFPNSNFNATNYWVDADFEVAAPVAPGPASNVTASGGPASASVSWTAPTSGGAVAKYVITPYIGSEAQTATTVTGSPPATNATIGGLTNGTSYTFTVTAVNTIGSSAPSEHSNAVTPSASSPPSAPTGASAIAASNQALVNWTAPASNGGSALTAYTITPFVGASAQTPVEVGAGSTSAIVNGLTDGTSYTFKVSASNAGGEGPQSGASNAITPMSTIFDFATPSMVDSGDGSSVELGVKFSSETAGNVTGIRFYKATNNTGTHVVSLYSNAGALLASATASGESASGWQQVNFAKPVAINPSTTYVAAYFAPNGHYSDTPAGLNSASSNPPLTALANATSADGIYAYTASSTFPTNSFNATNYWVDADFEAVALTPPGAASSASAAAGPGSATVTWSAPSSGGAVSKYIITPFIGSEAQTATTIAGSPPATNATITGLKNGTSYTFTVTASNSAGSATPSEHSNAVTPSATTPPTAPSAVTASGATGQALVGWTAPASNGGSTITSYTITPFTGIFALKATTVSGSGTSGIVKGLTNGTSYTFKVSATNASGESPQSGASGSVTPVNTIFDFTTPGTIDSGDGSSVELGVKFTSSTTGHISGIRFYKAAANTGSHVVALYSSAGALLASATASGESASGWQQVSFAKSIAITAGTTYVAAYFAPNGHYSDTPAGFGTATSNPPLTALANAVSGDGVFAYSPTATFPSNSFNATNYWVDVDWEP